MRTLAPNVENNMNNELILIHDAINWICFQEQDAVKLCRMMSEMEYQCELPTAALFTCIFTCIHR